MRSPGSWRSSTILIFETRGHTNHVSWDPAGVEAVITPWNAPLMLATWRFAPALAAGNTVVLKPPEWAPLTASLFADIRRDAGLPDGVFNVVQGIGEEAGAALVAHPDVARISFTGSVPTGSWIGAAAAANLTPVSLELGGKSPFLCFADADIEAVVGQIVNQFDNAGQVCLAGTRLLLESSIRDEVLDGLTAVAPRSAKATRGCADRRRAADHAGALRTRGRVRSAGEGRGGDAAVRGRTERGPRRPLLPADLVRRCRGGSEILTEEVFGPVLTAQSFDDEDEAVTLANATDTAWPPSSTRGNPSVPSA